MAEPITTQAILVGIEKYADPNNITDLNGPVNDVYQFCQWLLNRNVPPQNISVFVSPLDRNVGIVGEITRLIGRQPLQATKDIVTKALREEAKEKKASLYFLFWSGHGWISPQGDRRLIYADAKMGELKNLNLSAQLNAMQTDLYQNLDRQLLIIDACANSQLLKITPPDDLPSIGKHLPSLKQMVMFAANSGEYAINKGDQGTGIFSRELLNELRLLKDTEVWPPDMETVMRNVQQKFSNLREDGQTKQTPSFYSSQDWMGNRKQHFSEIEKEQQESKNKSAGTIALFEDIKLNSNDDRNEIFENLWSELCLILDKFNFDMLWDACSKIKKINKTQNDEVYIESLCSTKNYELLKQVFLDQYEPISLIIELGQLLENSDKDIKYIKDIKSWLDKAYNESKKLGATPYHNPNKNRYYLPPVLLIMIDKLANGTKQDKWNVRGQFKSQDQQCEILLSKDRQGSICSTFEEIPQRIKCYIDFIENDRRFSDKKIDKLRIELFLPLSEIKGNIDAWATDSENRFLITEHRLFLRIKERTSRRNVRIELLKKGWQRIEDFLNNDLEISKALSLETTKESKKHTLIEILNVSNWTKLTAFIENCPSLWCINWKGSLPKNDSDRINFFRSILNSGIPIAFWNWHSIPEGIEFETKLTDYLNRDNLSDRCQRLLETTWSDRRVAWGEKVDSDRQQHLGYYLGILLEDPEILPEDNLLETIEE